MGCLHLPANGSPKSAGRWLWTVASVSPHTETKHSPQEREHQHRELHGWPAASRISQRHQYSNFYVFHIQTLFTASETEKLFWAKEYIACFVEEKNSQERKTQEKNNNKVAKPWLLCFHTDPEQLVQIHLAVQPTEASSQYPLQSWFAKKDSALMVPQKNTLWPVSAGLL